MGDKTTKTDNNYIQENLLSYDNILYNIQKFKQAGGSSVYNGNEQADGLSAHEKFNILDTPAQKYFKIMFYFGNQEASDKKYNGSGLLHPTWLYANDLKSAYGLGVDPKFLYDFDDADKGKTNIQEISKRNYSFYKDENGNSSIPSYTADDINHIAYYDCNSAWSFLKINDEHERAEKLEQFITLLSNISSYSPWYFTSVKGIQEALDRKGPEDGKLDLNERKKLTIKCLPDAFDNRIDTLLSLYRDFTLSWIDKKEILPSNLRKFDMAIYIFEMPEQTWHTYANEPKDIKSKMMLNGNNSNTTKKPVNKVGKAVLGNNSLSSINYELNPLYNHYGKPIEPTDYISSFKMIEFHDCEFGYNSVKTAWDEISNTNGIQPEYQIEIFYNDCYEYTYNDIISRLIGDVVLTDLFDNFAGENQDGTGVIPGIPKDTPNVQSLPQKDNLKLLDYLDNRLNYYANEESLLAAKNKAKEKFGYTYGTLGNISRNERREGNAEIKYKNKSSHGGMISNLIGNAIDEYTGYVKSAVTKALLGNIFTFSLTQLWRDAKSVLRGDLSSFTTIKNYIDQENERRTRGEGWFTYTKSIDRPKYPNWISKIWDKFIQDPAGLRDIPGIGHWDFSNKVFTEEYWAMIDNQKPYSQPTEEKPRKISNITGDKNFTGKYDNFYDSDINDIRYTPDEEAMLANEAYKNNTKEYIVNYLNNDKKTFIDPNIHVEGNDYVPPETLADWLRNNSQLEADDWFDANVFVDGDQQIHLTKKEKESFNATNSQVEAENWVNKNIFKDPFPREPKYSSIDEANENSRKRPI